MIHKKTVERHNISKGLPACLLASLLMLCIGSSGAAEVQNAEQIVPEQIVLKGTLIQKNAKPDINRNISAVAMRDDVLVLGADEGADVLVFNKQPGATLKYGEAEPACISLDGGQCGDERKGAEIDIEGIAWGKKYLYVIGSHSLARKGVNANKSPEENKRRLETLKVEPTRDQLFRIKLNKNGKVAGESAIKRISLRNLFINHRLLSRFTSIPSKENGIDIEGLAVREVDGHDQLYIGFRGPVLRGNHAIVMVLEFDGGKFKENKMIVDAEHPKIFYLNLNGRGIRGMSELDSGGFLILAGPVGDDLTAREQSRYQVFFWNGEEDDLSGVARQPLCNIPATDATKAEGIEVLNKGKQASDDYHFLIVYDGAKKGKATVFSCKSG